MVSAQNFGAGRGVVDRTSAFGKTASAPGITLQRTTPRQPVAPPSTNISHNKSRPLTHNFPHNSPVSRLPQSPQNDANPLRNDNVETISISADAIRPTKPVPRQDVPVDTTSDETVSKPSSKKWNPATDPHPSIARIISFDKGDKPIHSFGSGTYLQDYGNYGVIVTNWHVVRDSGGLVQVHFPSGFTSYAAIMTFDSVWDLAVLLISKPEGIPKVKVASAAPRIGDPLWIAGYGGGKYRLVGGRCTKYLSPAEGYGAEFVDLAVEARKGDSGGPIFNQQGELAGVLFGSDSYNTAGSYCGRVRRFLELSKPKFTKVPARAEELFALVEPKQPKHTLQEGAEIFRKQVIRDYKKTQGEPTVLASTMPGTSNPRDGRGSSTFRGVKPQKLTGRASPSSGNLSFYPDFPDFYHVRSQTVQENPKKSVSKTVTPPPQNATSSHIASKKALIAKKNAAKSEAAKENSVKNNIAQTKERNDIPNGASQQPVVVSYQTASDDSTFAASAPSAKYGHSAPLISVQDLPLEVSLDSEAAVSMDGDSIPNSQMPQIQARDGKTSGNFFNTLKIIAVIVVLFFVIFHLVKLMSIIEENEISN